MGVKIWKSFVPSQKQTLIAAIRGCSVQGCLWISSTRRMPGRWHLRSTGYASPLGRCVYPNCMTPTTLYRSLVFRGEESGAAVRLLVHLMSLRNLDRPVIARGFLASAQLATMETLGARTIQMVPPSSIRTRERHILRRDPHVVTASSVDVETLKQGLTKMYL